MASHGTFADVWPFVTTVKKQLGAHKYVLEDTGATYKSGRPKVMVVFLDRDGREIAKREGMELESARTGKVYYVCRAEEDVPAQKGRWLENPYTDGDLYG